MKKYLAILILLSIPVASYGSYFKLTGKSMNDNLYVKVKSKDFISGNIYIQNPDATTICSGFVFGISPDSAKTLKASNGIFSKVTCNNGKLMEINWSSATSGKAIDQYDNTYLINAIKRKEYKKSIKQKAKIKNENKL